MAPAGLRETMRRLLFSGWLPSSLPEYTIGELYDGEWGVVTGEGGR